MKELRLANALLRAHDDHVLVTEYADPADALEMSQYMGEVEKFARHHAVALVLFDATRNATKTETPDIVAAREVRWHFFSNETRLRRIAVVTESPLTATRVNMTALARRARCLRAFAETEEARRWLRGPKALGVR